MPPHAALRPSSSLTCGRCSSSFERGSLRSCQGRPEGPADCGQEAYEQHGAYGCASRPSYAPALLQYYLRPGYVWRVSGRDLKDFYFQLRVDRRRWERQQVGPRVPASWFDELDELSLDERGPRDAWLWEDLHPRRASLDARAPTGFVQPCLAAMMMGDINSMSAAQLAHVGGLTRAGLLDPQLRLRRQGVCWGKSDLVDVYIDDVATLAAVPVQQAALPLWDSDPLEACRPVLLGEASAAACSQGYGSCSARRAPMGSRG